MATTIIHIAITKELNKYLQKEENPLLLGTIAPDLSKILNETKEISHFLDPSQEYEEPNLDKFLKKYKNRLEEPFILGIYLHLATDKYWYQFYIKKYIEQRTNNTYKKSLIYSGLRNLIYNDYTNLNKILIKDYSINIENFINNPPQIEGIKEISLQNQNILIEKLQKIIQKSHEEKVFSIDINEIEQFIEKTIRTLLKDLQELGIYKKSIE